MSYSLLGRAMEIWDDLYKEFNFRAPQPGEVGYEFVAEWGTELNWLMKILFWYGVIFYGIRILVFLWVGVYGLVEFADITIKEESRAWWNGLPALKRKRIKELVNNPEKLAKSFKGWVKQSNLIPKFGKRNAKESVLKANQSTTSEDEDDVGDEGAEEADENHFNKS